MATGRRFLGSVPRLTRRSWEEVAQGLEDFLRRLWASETDGIPAGWGNDTTPSTVEPGAGGSVGTGNQVGWSAADHSHPVLTGPPSGLADTNVEGVSARVPRLDHQHKRDVRVYNDGVDLGVFDCIDVVGTGIEAVELPPTVNTTDLYGYWPLDETSGNPRASILGAAPDLTESGGAITEVAGRFGNAASSTEVATNSLTATLLPTVGPSAGFTIALWVKFDGVTTNPKPPSILTIKTGATSYFYIGRLVGSNYIDMGMRWAAGAGHLEIPIPRLGPFDPGDWHLLVLTYDAATGTLTGRANNGCMESAVPWVGPALPSEMVEAVVPPASLAAANAITFDTLVLLKAITGSYVNIEGAVDDLRIWTRVLTDGQIADLWDRVPRVATVSLRRNVGLTVDNDTVLTPGFMGFVAVPFSGTITGWQLIADQVGDCVVDVWKADHRPTVLNSICGASKPTLAGARTGSGTVAWSSLAVEVGDIFGFYLDSVATITLLTIAVEVSEG